MKRVLFIQELLAGYRVEFYERLRERLLQNNVELALVHGEASGERALRNDEALLQWAERIRNHRFGISERYLLWQNAYRRASDCDLVVVEHASRHILTYLLLLNPRLRPKVAFWGHGADLQAQGRKKLSGAAKRFLGTWSCWWFAYTAGSAERVRQLGFPPSRTTVVQNAVYTATRSPTVSRARYRCVYLGSLHMDKRLDFLIASAEQISRMIPGFELVIAGDGPLRDQVTAAASVHPYLTYRGAVFGREKADLLASAELLLVPGLVGLVAVESFTSGTPIVTLADSLHSPEFEYLNPSNSVVIEAGGTADDYAATVAEFLRRPVAIADLREGCTATARVINVDSMVENFTVGILRALALESTA